MRSALIALLLVLGFAWLFIQRLGTGTETIVRDLFHQMARWSTAATQDNNPAIANLHANYGVGYMMALRSAARDEEIERIVGVADVRPIFQEVTNIQNAALLTLVRSCPGIAPTSPLAHYGSQTL